MLLRTVYGHSTVLVKCRNRKGRFGDTSAWIEFTWITLMCRRVHFWWDVSRRVCSLVTLDYKILSWAVERLEKKKTLHYLLHFTHLNNCTYLPFSQRWLVHNNTHNTRTQ